MAAGDFYKQDRVMRLIRALALFQAVPHGMSTRELAERLGVTQRTAQRDLVDLQSELHAPFVQVGARWRLANGFWLKPIVFNVHEAMAMLLSARLLLRFADRQNPFAAAAYEKVAAALPDPVKAPVMDSADSLSARPADPTFLHVLTALTGAWAERRKVVITYTMEDTFDREVYPLFIEPNASGHSCYLIAWDPKPDAPRSYRLERISAVRVLDEHFDPPLGFSIGKHLAHAWSVWTSEQPVRVEMRFAATVARRVKETIWHESQEVKELPDGSIQVVLWVAEPTELKHWVLGWGPNCEVIGPATFRNQLAAETAAMAGLYSGSGWAVQRIS